MKKKEVIARDLDKALLMIHKDEHTKCCVIELLTRKEQGERCKKCSAWDKPWLECCEECIHDWLEEEANE